MNVLIVGLGSIAQKHIKAIWLLFPEAIIYALRSVKDATDINNVINIYNFQEMPVTPDFIIISNPTSLHAATIVKCAELAVPIMIEKPLSHTLDNLTSALKVIKERKIPTYVACNMRFHPGILFLKEHLKGKIINEVNIYCGSYLPDWRPTLNFRELYSASSEMGGGVHLDLIHEIDYCIWLFGKPDEIHTIKRNVSHLEINAIDYSFYNFNYPTFVSNITLNYYRKDARRTVEVVMENETWNLDLLNCKIASDDGTVLFSKQHFDIFDTYYEQMKYFTEHIKRKQEMMNNIDEAFDVLKICLTNE